MKNDGRLLHLSRLVTVCALLCCCAPAFSAVIYVKPDGNDAASGLSWELAKKTVQAGIDAAVSGDEVWVAKGWYDERLVLSSGIGLYGGFVGTEASLEDRPGFPRDSTDANTTTLFGGFQGTVVTITPGASPTTILDGFTISHGTGTQIGTGKAAGGGVLCEAGTPVIRNNRVVNNRIERAYGSGTSLYGAGIYCAGGVLQGNTVEGNLLMSDSGCSGGGIWCSDTSVVGNTVSGNTLNGNDYGPQLGGGIYCINSTVDRNTISGNAAEGMYPVVAGVYSGASVIKNTIVSDNHASAFSHDACGGLRASGGVLSNNTVARNSGVAYFDVGCGGIRSSGGTVANNIVWENSGLSGYGGSGYVAISCGGIYVTNGTALNNNNVHGNAAGGDYVGATPGAGDISADPEFVDSANGNLRLKDSSPCIDSGLDSAVEPGALDMDGNARIYGERVDIGAYEFAGSRKVTTPVFSPTGGAYNPMPVITVTCARAGAAIHAMTDGTDPTPDSPAVDGPVVPVDSPFELRALAVKEGFVDSETVAAVYTLDPALPETRITINDGSPYTTSRFVRLTQWSCDPAVPYTQMCFSNDGTEWTDWEPFAHSRYWFLTEGEGSKTVYVQFKDAENNTSPLYSDSIVFDWTPPSKPTVVDAERYTTDTTRLQASWSATDATSGIVEYQYAVAVGVSWSQLVVGWKSSGTSTSALETGLDLQTNQTYRWLVKARNGIGLWSSMGSSSGTTIATARTVGEAKTIASGKPVQLNGVTVTSTTSDHPGLWIESGDRAGGVRVGDSLSLARGQKLDIAGVVSWSNGVPTLGATEIKNTYSQEPVIPPFFTTRSLANDRTESLNYVGVNPVGLLAVFAGRVTRIDTSSAVFYVDDGTRLADGMGPSYDPFIGLRVSYPTSVVPPAPGKRVRVTGIRTVQKVTLQYGAFVNGQYRFPGETLYLPVVRVRDQADIRVY